MPARILDVRDKIVEMIDDAAIEGAVGANASYLPEYFKQALSVQQIDVRAITDEMDAADRQQNVGSAMRVYRMEITVQQNVDAGDVDTIDELVTLTVAIAELFYPNKQLDDLTPIVAVNPEEPPECMVCDPMFLRDYGVFYSRITLALREWP